MYYAYIRNLSKKITTNNETNSTVLKKAAKIQIRHA